MPLQDRLEVAMAVETLKSPIGKAFVKLTTRSPKDSKKALARAHAAYTQCLSAAETAGAGPVSDNDRWRILSEETTKAGAVSTAIGALELLLDSDRVYEDLEFALRGRGNPKTESAAAVSDNSDGYKPVTPVIEEATAAEDLQLDLVARSWDPRLKPESEFRAICWDGKITCLCQYFHPLYFQELSNNKDQIQDDILTVFQLPQACVYLCMDGCMHVCIYAWMDA
jgi:hypothetical protein